MVENMGPEMMKAEPKRVDSMLSEARGNAATTIALLNLGI